MNLRDNSLGENYVLFRNWAILTIFGLNFLQKTANRDFGFSIAVRSRFGLDTLFKTSDPFFTISPIHYIFTDQIFAETYAIFVWCAKLISSSPRTLSKLHKLRFHGLVETDSVFLLRNGKWFDFDSIYRSPFIDTTWFTRLKTKAEHVSIVKTLLFFVPQKRILFIR